MKLLEAGALDAGRGSNTRAEISGVADLDALTPHLAGLREIVVDFPVFRDGRGFSIAAVLRGRGYSGELIAHGALLPDQARHLARTGFDAVELRPDAVRAEWERALAAHSTAYQPAEDSVVPIWRRRCGRAPARATETLEDKVRATPRPKRSWRSRSAASSRAASRS
jgi:phosphoadenosine phosphosulfate reductase